jgi:hypothetical protein
MRLGDLMVGWLDPSDWQIARNWLIDWLPHVRTYRTAKRANRLALLREINRLIFSDPVQLELSEGGLELHVPRTMCGACGLAVLPFLLPNGWRPERLAECRYRKCRKWFLRPSSRRGTAAEYCSRSHANNERVTRSRNRKTKKKRALPRSRNQP